MGEGGSAGAVQVGIARLVLVEEVDLIAADVYVLEVVAVHLEHLIDHAEYDLVVGFVQTRRDHLKVLAILAQVSELFELEYELHAAVGLYVRYHGELVLLYELDNLLEFVLRVMMLVAYGAELAVIRKVVLVLEQDAGCAHFLQILLQHTYLVVCYSRFKIIK